MDHAQSGVAIADRVCNHADRQQVVDLVDRAMLTQALLVDRVAPLHAAIHFSDDTVFREALADSILQNPSKTPSNSLRLETTVFCSSW